MTTRILVASLFSAALFAACSDDGFQATTATRPAPDDDASTPVDDAGAVTRPLGLRRWGMTIPTRTLRPRISPVLEDGELEHRRGHDDRQHRHRRVHRCGGQPRSRAARDFEAGLPVLPVAVGRRSWTPEAEGLGPTFNSDSCLGCHVPQWARQRRARSSFASAWGRAVAVRLPNYGKQFQPFGISGGTGRRFSGTLRVGRDRSAKADGTSVSLTAVSYSIDNPTSVPSARTVRISPRIAPQIVGQGLLGGHSRGGPARAGRSRRPERRRRLRSRPLGARGRGAALSVASVGKLVQPHRRSADRGAFSEDLGITSSRFPETNCPGHVRPRARHCAKRDGSPELGATRLAVPVLGVHAHSSAYRSDEAVTSEDVLGAQGALFSSVGCTSCHRPSFVTRPGCVGARALESEDLALLRSPASRYRRVSASRTPEERAMQGSVSGERRRSGG